MTTTPAGHAPLSLKQVVLCGAAIVTISMGIRHGFGLFLQPITMDRGWSRETFAFALAVQNLAWGLFSPLAGAWADRFGAMRVLMLGTLFYAGGLVLMALATSGLAFTGSAGLMIGVAHAGTTYAVVYGVIARNVAPEQLNRAMAVTAAAGSFGQFLMVPVQNGLIGSLGWHDALFVLALLAVVMLPLALGLNDKPQQAAAAHAGAPQGVAAALCEAFATPSFRLLTAAYFVCGFQLVFLGVHMPSYLKDQGLAPGVAATALALIGLFNVFGTYAVGSLAQRFARPRILSAIYALRALAIALFVLLPLSAFSVYVFAAAIGLLWLSTVPPTNGVVARIFGVRHMSMLSGIVFLSHQVGSFMGAWLGGALFEATGSYQLVWWITVALGLFAAAVNLPVRDAPLQRAAAQPA
jgi:predicted MFS family arabinose efflux permease